MDAPQYPGYHSQYWYPQSHSTGHYTSNYPPGSDVQPQFSPQVIPGAYPSVYSPLPSHYSTTFHPSNPFYGAEPSRPSSGPFPNQGCPAEQSSGPPGQHQHHHYSAPHCQGGSGYSGPYPQYSESTPNPPYPTSQPLPSGSQADSWTHPGGFGPSQQPWQPQPGQASPQSQYVRPAHPPAWPGTGSGAPPPYQPKDQKHQGGPPMGGKARTGPSSKPSTAAEISSPPQLYPRSRRAESDPAQSPPSPSPARAPGPAPAPGLARVQDVLSRVLLLQEDVDEFVGKKTDKSYRCLEELLTKELLVLDSVETGGQETIRQARKEAVQRIQAILDQLEKKAF